MALQVDLRAQIDSYRGAVEHTLAAAGAAKSRAEINQGAAPGSLLGDCCYYGRCRVFHLYRLFDRFQQCRRGQHFSH